MRGDDAPYSCSTKDLHELVQATFYDKFEYFSIGTGTSPAEFYYSLYIAIERVRQGKR